MAHPTTNGDDYTPASDLHLYYAPGACSLAPHIVLHGLGVPFTTTYFPPALLPASFAAVNPKLKLPVLALRGAIVTENPAILTALAQLAPSQHLLGASDLDRVRAAEWMNWLSGSLHGQGFGALWRPSKLADDETVWPLLQERARRTVDEGFETIEKDLAQGRWAVGEGFTVVDAYLYVFWRWGVKIGLEMEARFPKFKDLAERVVKREATRKALEVEGIESAVSV